MYWNEPEGVVTVTFSNGLSAPQMALFLETTRAASAPWTVATVALVSFVVPVRGMKGALGSLGRHCVQAISCLMRSTLNFAEPMAHCEPSGGGATKPPPLFSTTT